jgi:hypothetical protein
VVADVVAGDVGMITIHRDLLQGSDEWLEARRGLITASEMRLLITPTGKRAQNDKARAHLYDLLAQRITGHVEPAYISDDMLRGTEDETIARELYAGKYAPVEEVGFITNDQWGFTLGYSPDGLVGDDGLIEIKSRRAKFQVETILRGEEDPEYMWQMQTGMLVTGRQWCDFISYSGGLPMFVRRVFASEVCFDTIIATAVTAETWLAEKRAEFDEAAAGYIPTERRVEQEMTI